MEQDKSSRAESAYARLRQAILSAEFPPGFQATEPEFAAHLGMSRTPVREALLRLEAEGLVELVPRKGARVRPVSADDMREIYEILTAFEPEAAAAVAETHPSEADLAPLTAATQAMEAALDRDDLCAWADADDSFHRTLLEMHGNRRMIDFVSHLFDQAHRARMVTLRLRDKPVTSTRDHRDLLEHLRAGAPIAAREAFRDHRRRSARELLDILKTYQLPPL